MISSSLTTRVSRVGLGPVVLGAILGVTLWIGVARSAAAQVPRCTLGTPAAIKFEGLGWRAYLGEVRDYSVESSRRDDWEDASAVLIRMTDSRGRVFYSRRARTPATGFVRLDWGDRFAKITATVEQVRTDPAGARNEATRCTATIERRIRARTRKAFFPSRCYELAYRPRNVIVACGDGNFQLRGMRWRSWNRRTVKGRGSALVNDCVPYCAAGRFHRLPVRVTLSRPRRCANVERYVCTRLSWRYLRGIPSVRSLRGSAPFPCRMYN